ncbi:sialidase-3-like [Amphiura filiformis]|uniref:sialidase-3-like n=1 Tax=Amphiura filiformis TaxID=82378 RepID=UPI003B21A448
MKSRELLVILGCGVLALIWLASHMRTPRNRVYDDTSGKVSNDDVRASRGFKPATPVETEAVVLFYQDMNGYNTTRIPALVYHHDMFFAFAEGRRETFEDVGKMDIILRRGRRKDWKVAWGPVEIIARQSGYRMMNPVPIVDREMDMILLVYNAHPLDVSVDKTVTTKLMSIKSFDLGVTWTEPQDMNHEVIQLIKPRPSMYSPGPGHGIQMKSGRLIVPGYFFSAVSNSKQIGFRNGTFTQSNVIYSDDHSDTWRPGGSLGYREHTDGRAIFSNEATVVELDNELCINSRTLHPDQPRVLSFSNDKGAGFSTPKLEWSLQEPGYYINDTAFWKNRANLLQGPFLLKDKITSPAFVGGCQASTIGFTAPQPLSPSNTWVVFSNPASFKTRRNMALKISKDGCERGASHGLSTQMLVPTQT